MITVQISTNTMMASEVMAAHSTGQEGMSGGMGGVKSEAYREKGYRALSKTSSGNSTESGAEPADPMMQQKVDEAHAIVGGAYVMVSVQGGDGNGQAKEFLKLIDFDKLISIVGK
jgi:hypothetical protein